MQKATKYKLHIGIGLLAAIAYLILPTDVLPDAMPALGWIDDVIAVLLAVANAIRYVSKLRKEK